MTQNKVLARNHHVHLSVLGGTALAAAVLIAACGGGGGGDSSVAAGDGTLRLALTDAPACGYEHVWVTVEKVRVHINASAGDADGGWREVVLTTPRRIDLLTLTNGVLEELGTTTLPAGAYSQVRLVLTGNSSAQPLANAVQPTGGAAVALDTPSALQSGLKLQARFDVAAGQMADLLLDFDACRSVVPRGNSGQFNLKPVVAVTPRLVAGITGYVSPSLVLGSTTVSAQQDGSVRRASAPDSTGRFVLPSLVPGTYTVVVTSDGRSTAVVSSVPVGTATGLTAINSTTSAITPATSAMLDLTGTAVVSTGSGTATTTAPLADGEVRALQVAGSVPVVEVSSSNVNADTSVWRLRLPVAAPQVASFAPTGTLSFTVTPSSAYTIEARAPGRTAQTRSFTPGGTGTTSLSFSFSP